MLARTRRNTRWPRRRSSVETPADCEAVEGFIMAGRGLSGAIGLCAPAAEVEVFMGVGVAGEADLAAGTLKDSSFKVRHPRNHSQSLVIPHRHPNHRRVRRL